MMNRCRPGIRLTHLPTGETVDLRCLRNVQVPRLERHARAILKAKLSRAAAPARPVRSYHMSPAWFAGIRQGGEKIVEGYDGLIEVLDGRSEVLP